MLSQLKRKHWSTAAVLVMVFAPAAVVFGGAHTWRVTEIFSNADGTIQFIELTECCGLPNELGVNNGLIASNSNSFNMVGLGVTGSTANKSILIASQGFAELCGAPTPNYIIPNGMLPFFFSTTADNVRYATYGNIAFTAGQLPLDGVNSLHRSAVGSPPPPPFSAPNSPRNYAGVTGFIDVSGPPCGLAGDIDGSGDVDGNDIGGFTRILLGSPEAGDNVGCFNAYCDPTPEGKIAAFVDDLIG